MTATVKIRLDTPSATYVIRAYGPGQVTVNQQVYTRTLVVMPNLILPDWSPQCFDDLTLDQFADLSQYPLDIVLIGTGERLRFPAQSLLAPLRECHIGVESMDTGAACRTYNLLVAERRQVAAVLLMI